MKKPLTPSKKNIPKCKNHVSDKKVLPLNNDVLLPRKESGVVPPPTFTLEQLLANIPEPDFNALKSKSSKEVETGKPVGEEVW